MPMKMLFILGRGRSGTTLLSKILNAHPNLYIAPDTQAIKNLHDRFTGKNWSEHTIDQFIDELFCENRFNYWSVSKKELKTHLSGLLPILDFQDAIKKFT